MTQPAKASEPSMEEILASIRRIIADDDATKSTPPAAEAPKPAVEPPAPPAPPPRLAAAPARAPDPSAFDEPEAPSPAAENIAGAGDQEGDILELTESMTAVSAPSVPPPVAPAPAHEFRTIDADSDVGFDETPEPSPLPPSPPSMKPARSEEPPKLLSPSTSAAVDSAFNTLAQTVLVQNARTLEDLVREMLRPLLKSWLDDNLPSLVERLVRAEIERVSRGR
jgi:uncharacterized protein